MIRPSRKVFTAASALTLSLGLAACGAGNEGGSGDGSTSSAGGGSAAESVSGSIKGAGASSMEKAQGEWMAKFSEANPDATVEYSPDGSGTGREKFINGAVNFAGSDSAMDEEEMASAKEKGCTGETIQFPVYVSPIAVAYNLEGVDELNLSPEVMADIFNHKITSWDDEKIKADNPDADLPSTAITTVNRSDDSGTTENFATYLKAAAPDNWPHEPEDAWPVKGGEAAKGTSGVVGAIEAGQGTIGYADASQIGDLGAAKVKAEDEFIEYSPEAAAKILESAKRVDEASKTNYAVELDQANAGAGVYPVVLVSYAIACSEYGDAEAARTTKAYLEYIASQEGQDAAAAAAGSAPLSPAAQENAKAALSNIKVD
ncbi:phosphate ABC transporter substrate-binding protein PstS [Janibacter sp. YIM B02568]|uniref:phosphate ABC transporter substrate-binding protein PstS n=1 Tax=Janibacter endophyticus TaxID=2806261 RepID=UPI0019516B6E|nr:phosphate ABC transporter substrate-binding protein PstS [Janibacter endophyticus]MBM6545249.1 phosphate ABC transporter substrate-binding protein PstS [Janibacter endophyticus]